MCKTLSSWRGVLVVAIILYHIPVAGLDEAAHLGVSLCFIISGAMLVLRHPRVEVSWRQWMLPRARRIYGIHWLVLALLLALMLGRGALKPDLTLAANALLVHGWIPVRSVYLSYNTPTWFLCSLLCCYACYPVLLSWLGRLSRRGQWAVALAVMLLQTLVMGAVSQAGRDWLMDMPLIRLCEFVWGMVLGGSIPAIDNAVGVRLRRHATWVEAAVIAAVAVVLVTVRHNPWLDCCEDTTVWWIPCSMVVVMCLLLNGHEGLAGRLMRSRPMTWLGSISLEAFMLASVVSYGYCHYLSGLAAHFGHPEFYDISWPVTLPLTLLLAHVLHVATRRARASH